MKYCTHCGASIHEDAAICPNCGCAVKSASTPMYQMKTNRGLLKFILLSIITFGIYGIVTMSSVSSDIDLIATKNDGQRTTNYMVMMSVFGPLTLGIYIFVWYHKFSNRIGNELYRRGIDYGFSASTFWLWDILGVLLFGIGPLVYMYKMFKAMNLLSEDFNING